MRGIDLTGRGELPLYEYLYRCIRDQVVTGEIAAEERLPSRRTLAERLGVSVVTVEGAYAQLVAEGYVVARSRRGYYAASLPSLPNVAVTMPVVAASAHAAKAGWEDKRAAGSVPYDLTRGANVASPGAARLWERALRDVISHEPDDVLYRTPPARGVMRLREAIADHLARSRGMSVDPELVVVGAGAQALYGLVAQLLREGGPVGVEDPGYARASETYRAHGLDVRYLPLDAEGISVRALRGSCAAVAHVMPSHQFPTGRVMSVARRYELLGWAAEKDRRYLVEDDYDCELRLAGRPIPALASIDATGSVLYLNTFSMVRRVDACASRRQTPAFTSCLRSRTTAEGSEGSPPRRARREWGWLRSPRSHTSRSMRRQAMAAPGSLCSTTGSRSRTPAPPPARLAPCYRPSLSLTWGNGRTAGCSERCSPRSRSIHTVSYQRPNL